MRLLPDGRILLVGQGVRAQAAMGHHFSQQGEQPS